MKKLIFPLLLLLTVNYYSQEIPEDANAFIFTVKESSAEAFKNFGKFLLKEGYLFETIDNNFGMIVTKIRTIPVGFLGSRKIELRLTVEMIDNPIRIKIYAESIEPFVLTSLRLQPSFDLYKKRVSTNNTEFEYLDEQMKKFSKDSLSYLVEKEKK